MPRVGFEPKTPVFKRAKMVHALDRAATVIGHITRMHAYIHISNRLSGIHHAECWFSNGSAKSSVAIFRVNDLVGDWKM
jgi:hypothetical protein